MEIYICIDVGVHHSCICLGFGTVVEEIDPLGTASNTFPTGPFEPLENGTTSVESWLQGHMGRTSQRKLTLDVVVPCYRVQMPFLDGISQLHSSDTYSVIIIDNPLSPHISELLTSTSIDRMRASESIPRIYAHLRRVTRAWWNPQRNGSTSSMTV